MPSYNTSDDKSQTPNLLAVWTTQLRNGITEGGEPSANAPLQKSDQEQLFRDVVLNVTTLALSSLSGLIIIPLLFHSVRRELFGTWLIALAMAETATILNSGLGRSVVRETAQWAHSERGTRPGEFVSAACWMFAALGVLGAVYITAAGRLVIARLSLPQELQVDAHRLFVLVGARFFFEQMTWFAFEALGGLRRFDKVSLVSISASLLRAASFLTLMRIGTSMVALAVADLCVACLVAAGGIVILGYAEPSYLRVRTILSWRQFLPQLRFGVTAQLASICNMLVYDSAPFVIGLMRGAVAVVPFEIGQRVPSLLEKISWQASAAMFPAAAEYHQHREEERSAEVLRFGTRIVFVVVLPLCVVLSLLAPEFIGIWMRDVVPEAATVMRLLIFTMLLDAAAATAFQVLWAQGRAGTVVLLVGTGGVLTVALSLLLIKPWAIVGCAAAIGAGVALSGTGALLCACQWLGENPIALLKRAVRGTALPTAASAASACIAKAGHFVQTWPSIVLVIALASAVYLLGFLGLAADAREKEIIWNAVSYLLRGRTCRHRIHQ